MVDLGYLVGWLGVLTGLLVAPPQLIKIIKTGRADGISLLTYIALVFAMVFYLLHAIYIGSLVFVAAQSVNLVMNAIILWLLVKNKRRVKNGL